MMTDKLKYLLINAIEAAIEGGNEIKRIYNNKDFGIEYKADHSPVTIADKLSSKKITSLLAKTNIPVLSEEENIPDYSIRKNYTELWIVDPLDGTKEFIKKNGEFCVNIGLVSNGTPILGVIYIPVTNELYYGSKEIGAFKIENVTEFHDNILDKGITLPTVVNEDLIVVSASRSHSDPESIAFFNKLKQSTEKVEFLEVGSAIKFCKIAEGIVDFYPRFNPCMEWDTAAGHALVQGIGKDVFHVNTNNPLVYNKADLYSPFFIVK